MSEERYSPVLRLSDSRYSAKGTKRKGRCASINRDRNGDIQAAKRDRGRYASSKARLMEICKQGTKGKWRYASSKARLNQGRTL